MTTPSIVWSPASVQTCGKTIAIRRFRRLRGADRGSSSILLKRFRRFRALRWRILRPEIPIEWAASDSVLLGVADTTTSVALSEAAQAEGVCAKFFSNIDEARTLIAKDRPFADDTQHDPPRINGMDMYRAIRGQANDDEHRLPVVDGCRTGRSRFRRCRRRHGLADQAIYRRLCTNQDTRMGIADSISIGQKGYSRGRTMALSVIPGDANSRC